MWILIPLLLLAGCIQSNPEPEAAKTAVPTAVPTLAPVAIRIAVDETEPPMTAIPTPTASPTPEPTATPSPEPTATPNPYRAETVTAHKESEDFWYCELTEATKERIIGSTFPENPKDCPVKITDLRYVSLLYVDFEGETHTGELIVNRKVADDVIDIFYALYRAAYPLTSVKLLDDFGEKFDDNLSMAANNTSSFCCRPVTGSKKFSLHASGLAIDVNPMMNPYIRPDKSFAPPNGEAYLDRSQHLLGMIDENDLCYKLFTEHGWSWGGHFKGEKDYQHFSKK
jgi:hypothetical protein